MSSDQTQAGVAGDGGYEFGDGQLIGAAPERHCVTPVRGGSSISREA